jgi:hypothetical protein
MNEPIRLREETDSELERLLLRAGTSYGSSTESRAKTLAALGLTGSAALAVGAASAAPMPALAKATWQLTWTKVLAAVTAIGAVAAGPPVYRAWHRRQAATISATGEPNLGAHVAIPAEPAARDLAAGGAFAREPAPEPTPTPATPAVRSARAAAPGGGKTGPAGANLTRELAALDAARSALAEGDAAGALTLLDAYARGFPRGGLDLEAEVLRIDALAKAGRNGQARRRAQAFLRRHPNSVLASRARRYLDD